MSFRKRNEPLSGPRTQSGAGLRPSVDFRTAGSARAGSAQKISPSHRVPLAGAHPHPTIPSNAREKENSPPPMVGVRPSSVSSLPTVSTGCADLDRVLIHQGLPLSNSLLIEESGTTDFASVLLRAFAAQGVVHNRLEKGKLNCHVIVVGPPSSWAKDLPSEYKGTSKDQKRAKIAQDSSQVSVSNMAERDLKIAWRYGINGQGAKGGRPIDDIAPADTGADNYVTQLDITKPLVPGASAQEISFVPVSTSFNSVIEQVSRLTQLHTKHGKVVRIVVPGFLNPSIYPPTCSSPKYVVPLIHGLRGLLSQQPTAVMMLSLALDLYPREGLITHIVETLVDGVVNLQPFNPDMAAMIERAYKNEPAKIQQGLVNVYKVPLLSDRGMMMVTHAEYAFKNGRKKFEIEEWGIPVDDTEETNQASQPVDF